MRAKYPLEAYRGFRAYLPDWSIGWPTARDQTRAVRLLGLRPGDWVCDPSCGPGFNLQRLVRAVGPTGLVIAVEDNAHLMGRAEAKVRRGGWSNVQLLSVLDPEKFQRPFDGMIVSFNPPIFLQRPDLVEAAWRTLKPGGQVTLVAGRCTTFVGRVVGPFIRLGLKLSGHSGDWHYWTVHEPWRHLEELAAEVSIEPRLGFQYLLWAEKGK